jgi:hypothetical protein
VCVVVYSCLFSQLLLLTYLSCGAAATAGTAMRRFLTTDTPKTPQKAEVNRRTNKKKQVRQQKKNCTGDPSKESGNDNAHKRRGGGIEDGHNLCVKVCRCVRAKGI